MCEQNENTNKKTETIKKNLKKRTKQILELKNAITELRSSLYGFNIKLVQAKERIHEL